MSEIDIALASLRLIFMGTSELAGESLRALIHSGLSQIPAVVCQPDQPKGRGLRLQQPPVKQLALQEHLPVLQPERARDEDFINTLHRLEPDLIVVAAYGQILPRSILELPRHGCLNVHTSLLPKYRGAAPIQRAILNGDSETGVTIMKINEGLDAGDIVAQETTVIDDADNSQTLHDRLAQLGARLLVNTIPAYVAGRIIPQPQASEQASYAPKISKEEGQIDWTQPAPAVRNRVRALVPWPGAFTRLPGQQLRPLLKIWEAEVTADGGEAGVVLRADKGGLVIGCGAGALRVLALQREGGRRLNAQEFLAGHRLQPGEQVG